MSKSRVRGLGSLTRRLAKSMMSLCLFTSRTCLFPSLKLDQLTGATEGLTKVKYNVRKC